MAGVVLLAWLSTSLVAVAEEEDVKRLLEEEVGGRIEEKEVKLEGEAELARDGAINVRGEIID